MKRFLLLLLFTIFMKSAYAQTFTLRSQTLGGQATAKEMFNSFGCTGENISPDLYWENPPEGTKSFAITMYDPDAPTGSGWWHWITYNIPASTKGIPSGAGNLTTGRMPTEAIQSMADFGSPGYGGPCPPEGDKPHQYIITLYALGTEKIALDKSANPALVGFYLNANTVAKASLVFYNNR